MNTKTATKVFLLLILLLPSYAAAGLGGLRLSFIEGDVQIKTVDTEEWNPAVINFPLKDGDQLWVPDQGRAAVESRRGTILRLDERTALDILTVDNDVMQFYLGMGLAYVNAKGVRGTTLQMDTPLSSIRVYERAKFSVDVSNDSETDISVFAGEIVAENEQGVTKVEGGKTLALGKDWADLAPLSLADEWERWNKDQDRTLEERRESARYLPEDLAGYAHDFDNNGEWVDMPLYGHVWRPTVHIGVDWSPYRHGRWIWIGDDYVWIANESWGWAPYHYGRWSFDTRQGWYWVPPARDEVRWGPGYVGWVHTPTYVAWVPLAPKEVYYGRGDYGANSVNVLHVDVTKVVVNNIYKNVYVNNSVTTIHNDTFIRGQKVDFKVKENPFLKEKISVGRPRLKPERASMIASVREIAQAKEPPAKLKGVKVEALKKQRRLVTKRDQSVFVKDTAPQAMKIEVKKEPRAKGPRKAKVQAEESPRDISPTMQEAQQPTPAPAARVSPPQEPSASTLPAKIKRERKQRPPPGAGDKQATNSNEVAGPLKKRRPTQPPAPKQEAQPAPAEREKLATEPSPTPPTPPTPDTKRERKQRPPPGVEEKQLPPRDTGDSLTKKRRPAQTKAPTKEAKPDPAATREGEKEAGETSSRGHKKKVKKGQPEETEEVPPETSTE